ncbi:hypothetical protein M899_3248 [Bacteriovorax sp. BSW11_IV]|uniref:hypothetical protein n=1 Tax=Bacteriovorax sp. BSW11_IV TaxID=1353529 RepID=UPI000389F957|nr:hypothetical protein [Bacteriovorax sp. BSW11_IV]EQC48230.1 hypothetical protein M899_3248 [Bacteriovorax sp. BSW11_IV]
MWKKYLLSLAISSSYLSAVADRFGLWGVAGADGVVWGNYEQFLAYTKYLNGWAPEALIPFLGGSATFLEIILPLMFIFKFKVRYAAIISTALLSTFALAMIFSGGLKGPLDYSVFTAIFASLILVEDKKAKGQE